MTRVLVLFLIFATSAFAVELPVYCDFDMDTPGTPPAEGGADQPTVVVPPPGGSILVETGAHGLDTQPCVVDDGGFGDYGYIRFSFDPVTEEILRVEAVISLNQYMNTYPVQTSASNGYIATRLGAFDTGDLTDYLGTTIGSYTPGVPFAVRMDVNVMTGSWTCIIDEELDGFEDDTSHQGLAFVNDPGIIPDLGHVYFDINTWNTTGSSAIAFDDILIDLNGTAVENRSWSWIKSIY